VHPFTKRSSQSVSHLGEEKLISEIKRWLGASSPRAPFVIGDDCALLPPSRGSQLITVDPVIYPHHFDDQVPARQVGAKLLKRNLSDLAAMGGKPTAAVLALTLGTDVSVIWLEQFYRGLAACARRHRVSIVGGDIAQAENVLAASLTLLGEATGSRTLTRTGARRGDRIYVTGVLGGSLRTGHHYRFTPRLAEGAWLARRNDVRAMMDVSDGVAKDLHAITPPGTAPALDAKALPMRAGATIRAALSDGEDYELLFALSAKASATAFEREWAKSFQRVRLSCIGTFVTANQVPEQAVNLAAYRGYEHLKRHVAP
jgi:thiamine-monophosphate kinase